MKIMWKQKQEMSFQIAWLNKLSNDTAVITAPVEPWKTLESLPSMQGVHPRTWAVRHTS